MENLDIKQLSVNSLVATYNATKNEKIYMELCRRAINGDSTARSALNELLNIVNENISKQILHG